jgi:hypothetical protein
MANIDIKSYIDQLRQYLPYVPLVPVEAISALHRKRDLGGIVKLIRNTMNVNVHLVLHWTDEVRGNAPAWVTVPKRMPYYGTPEFKKIRIDMFIRKSFAEAEPYDRFAIAVAHEFSHVVLDSIDHPLRHDEKAVDLTAMILGFSHLYRRAAYTIRRVSLNEFQRRGLGYLSEHELDQACQILVPRSVRAKYAASRALWHAKHRAINALLLPATLLVLALGVGVVAEAFDFLSDFLKRHLAALHW